MSFDLKLFHGDLQIKNGDIQIVEKSEKLVQDILKILLTPAGSNPFFPWYGSIISRSLVGMPFDFKMMGDLATNYIKDSLTILQKMQAGQIKDGQRLDAEELLSAVQNVRVTQNTTDPRYYKVAVNVLSRAFTSVPVGFDISL